MKKLLYTIGFLMFATAALQPVVTLGQESFSAEESDVPYSSARIFSELWGGNHPEADWGTSFGADDPSEIGQDLYYMVYEKTEFAPQRQAVKETAGKYALDQGELNLILNGNYNVIAEKRPGLTQEELQEKIVEIQQEHKWRMEMHELKAQVKAQVETNEIFANGDVSDSGFDLINDLTIIEELLFLQTHPIDVGNAYTSVGLEDIVPGSDADIPVPGPGPAPGTGTAPSGISDTTQPAEEAGEGPVVATEVAEGAAAGTGAGSAATTAAPGEAVINPNACFVDEGFLDALEEFEDKSKTDPNYKDVSARQQQPGGAAGDADGADGAGTGGTGTDGETIGTVSQALSGDLLPPQPDTDYSNLQPAGPDQWLQDKVCNDVFCLQVNMVTKPATSSYADSDNCIACHVEKINDVLKDTLNHSLAPTKAPGNLAEAALCKKAAATSFSSVSMNFYAIPMPVRTPPNDDIIFGTSVEQEWQRFCEQTAFFPFDTCMPTEEEIEEIQSEGYKLPPILTDRAAKQAIDDAQEDATQEDVISRIDEIVTGYALESNEAVQKLEAQRKTDESLITYQPLLAELDQMNYYFTNIQKVIHSLHEEVEGFPGKQACVDIKNKKECE